MKNSLLMVMACLLISATALSHGGTYGGPAGVGTPTTYGPAGGGTTTGGTNGGTGTGGGVTGGATTAGSGGTTNPGGIGGAPARPGGAPSPAFGGAGPRGRATGGGRKKPSNPYLNWEWWWHLNDDRFLLLKKKLRMVERETTNSDTFFGSDSNLSEAEIAVITKKNIRKKIIPTLIYALKDPYYDTRAGAVIALAKVAKSDDLRALGNIIPLLKDRSSTVREAACLALGILGHEEAIPLLKNIVSNNIKGKQAVGRKNDVLNRTRSFAAYGLGLIGHQRHNIFIKRVIADFLVKTIRSKNLRDLKVASAISLHLLNEKSPVPQLIELFKDSELDPYVKAHIGIALGKLRARASAPTLAKAIDHKNEHISRSAAIALGLVVNPDDKKLINLLRRKASAGSSRSTRNFSLISLGEVGSALGTKTLLDRFKKGQAMDKAYAALALGIQGFNGKLEFKSEVAEIIYEEYMVTKSANLKGALAISLGLLDATNYVEDIRKDIDEIGTQSTQGYLAIALALLNDQHAIPTIRELVRLRGDVDRRKMAAIALGMLRDKKAISLLEEVMKESSNSKAILGSATVAMGHIGDRSAVPILSNILNNRKDHQDVTRAFATVALGYLGDKDDIPVLSKIHAHCNYMANTESLAEILTIL